MHSMLCMLLLLTTLLSSVICKDENIRTSSINGFNRPNRAIITLSELLERTMWPEEIRTVKTRRAPSLDNNYQWESMMQSLDNLRKPRFGR
ncbi:unnamed protein product [Bursaphelenchus okinawaensis]|uniref:Uncharacterized protein n=1 Tax=Bursaphelenchus okinawaensis TaxID=465554 RepID=A0A811JRS4_9BILA|nr:unnamed protein product [Bursaphelenchus okinawaensis]CAG9080240.1 unnamed protein product [Bursaphelenchus okinawaensis]